MRGIEKNYTTPPPVLLPLKGVPRSLGEKDCSKKCPSVRANELRNICSKQNAALA
jgi:hypothetical protein